MKKILYFIGVVLALNFAITGFIDWCYNPSMSQMEIFLRTPQHFLWDFKN
jgi:hypothetical protein